VVATTEYIDAANIPDCETLKRITQKFVSITKELLLKHLKYINITKCSKA